MWQSFARSGKSSRRSGEGSNHGGAVHTENLRDHGRAKFGVLALWRRDAFTRESLAARGASRLNQVIEMIQLKLSARTWAEADQYVTPAEVMGQVKLRNTTPP